MNVEPEIKRQSQTVEHLGRTSEEVSELHGVIAILADRLSTALRLETPEKVSQEDALELVPLAHSIKELEFSVKDARAKIESILGRLEL